MKEIIFCTPVKVNRWFICRRASCSISWEIWPNVTRRYGRRDLYRDEGVVLRTLRLGEGRPHRHDPDQAHRQGRGGRPRRPQDQNPASAPAWSPSPTSTCSSTPAGRLDMVPAVRDLLLHPPTANRWSSDYPATPPAASPCWRDPTV